MSFLEKIKFLIKNIKNPSIEYYCLNDIDFISDEPQVVYKYIKIQINDQLILHKKIGIYILNKDFTHSPYQTSLFLTNNFQNIEIYMKKIS